MLEYDELKEARSASLNATHYAIKAVSRAKIAIIISIVAMIASITFSIIQLHSSTKIDTVQFDEIKELINTRNNPQ